MKRIKYVPQPDLSADEDLSYVVTDREGYVLAIIEVNGDIVFHDDVDVYTNGISAREAVKYDEQ